MKRGTFASRAHSFKENFLDAIKSSQYSSTPHKRSKGEKSFIQLAKKTGSTDNLTGHLGTTRSTDCLVKEVQFALKYFQDVVSKRTYEMLPGCATVVLETVLAIQVSLYNSKKRAKKKKNVNVYRVIQLNIAVCFWYLIQSDLSSVHV